MPLIATPLGLGALRLYYRWLERREWTESRRVGFQGESREQWYADLWREAAAELSAGFTALPSGFGEVRLGDRLTRVYQQMVMLDDPVTLKLAGHKPIVHHLLAAAGLPVPAYREFRWNALAPAAAFLSEQQAPCVVKPAAGTGAGRGVTTHVRCTRDLALAAARAAAHGRRLVIERQVPGESYRLLYLDGVLLDAVRRRPPGVLGDGTSTVRALIARENGRRSGRAGRAVVDVIPVDLDCRLTLEAAGHSLRSVPAAGCRVVVRGVSNHGSEEDTEGVREELGSALIDQGARAAAALGVRLAGVDVITPDVAAPLEAAGGVVNEVNTTPGLHFHYQVRNPAARTRVAVAILRTLLELPAPAAPRDLPGRRTLAAR